MTRKTLSITTLLILCLSITVLSAKTESNLDSKNIRSNVIRSVYIDEALEKDTKTLIKNIKNPERFQMECDKKKIAKSCFLYAINLEIGLNKPKESYDYYKKAFDLGDKIAGYAIADYQIHHPEWFDEKNKITIDESLEYLEQAMESGSSEATRLLTLMYRTSDYNPIDYSKAEYYNKIAIEQNKIRGSRLMLANLYTHNMKDRTKIDTSIKLYKEDLILESNLFSAINLTNIYLFPHLFGSKQDYPQGLAYAYIARDIRKKNPDNSIKNVEEKIINVMERDVPKEILEQAQSLYKEIKAEMDTYAERNKE